MRVNTNVPAINVYRNLTLNSRKFAESLKKLSSGYRINSAKDDASGLAVANRFRADIASLKVAHQNAAEAQSMLQVADGAYSKIYDILVRMKELATQAASDQTVNEQLTSEFINLQSEITRIAESTKYNTTVLINGGTIATQGLTFQIGQTNDAEFQLNIKLATADADALGVDIGDISIETAASARAAMTAIDSAIDSINQYMSQIGANQNRLQYTMENLEISIENFSASESTIRDVDMAEEVTNFTKLQILQQSGIAMLAQANMAPQQVLRLLQG
ncbi:MAG: flagellin [Thermodesulforhabdaceae bacterium]